MIFKVNMQPFASCDTGLSDCDVDHFRPETESPKFLPYHRVKKKRMNPTVPDDIYESDKIFSFLRAYPAEAVLINLRPPVIMEKTMIECLSMKPI